MTDTVNPSTPQPDSDSLDEVKAMSVDDFPILSCPLDEAWEAAEKALPEGWVLAEVRIFDDRSAWGAEAANDTGVGRYREMGFGPTPTAALIALAQALEGVK